MTVAVLALQGAFLEHEQMLKKLGADYFEIRQKKDLDRSFDALILPGGESTVMRKLLLELDIYDALKAENPVRSASLWNLCGTDPSGR